MAQRRADDRPATRRRAYTIRDQIALRRLDSFVVSPDGALVVLQIARAARRQNRLDTALWVVNADGTRLRRLPSSGGLSSPAFSPDGRSIYALSGPSTKKRQVVRLGLDGGRTTSVTQSPVDVESFVLSRDGASLAFSAQVYPGGPDTLASTAERLAAESKDRGTGRVYDQLFARHWDRWANGRRRHLFVQPVAGGPAVDVMPEMAADAPTRPFGGREQFGFSADGTQLVFTARDAGREEAWSTNLDLFAVPIDASSSPRNLTSENEATDTDPAFSPDGSMLAYLAMDRAGYEADKLTVILRGWPHGETRRLTDGWDRSADAVAWAAGGRTLYVTAEDTGQRGLFAIDVATGAVTPLVTDGSVSSVKVAGDRIFYSLDSLDGPADLYVLEDDRHRRITRLNAGGMRDIALGDAEQFSFAGWNDETVHGYVVRPADFDPARTYPVAFIIHGGPQGSSGNHWHYRWNPQVYAGAGYAVVMIDFHGSTGYGQAFTDSIRGDWGGKPLEDLQKGFAAALDRYPFLDRTRAAALGASFGGYMVNLIAGVWNEPWRCLVSHDGNLDERFAYFATEELWFPEWEHSGTPWENPAAYAQDNPADHPAAFRVPTLVIHGALDYRVSEVEGLAMFTALQRQGVPSRFLHFPDENHWVLKPQNSVLWHDTVLEWLDRWTATDAPPSSSGA
ncbi:MAG: prolyl oligopeptidase family serine peptidase [Chloroflexota bacterium]